MSLATNAGTIGGLVILFRLLFRLGFAIYRMIADKKTRKAGFIILGLVLITPVLAIGIALAIAKSRGLL